MFKFAKKETRNQDESLILARRNLLRVKVACETALNNESLNEEDKRKIIDLARMDANAALNSLQIYMKKA